jgi:ATP-dependent helicase YprA (DUF1998 family)
MADRRIVPLVEALASRAAEAAIGRSRIALDPLREALRARLSRPAGQPGALLAAPVLEAAFGHLPVKQTLQELVADGLLHQKTVAALAEAAPIDPKEGRERNTLPPTLRPYTHQVEAWRLLKEEAARSVLVSAGTGSGKTESFLVPILDDFVRQSQEKGTLTGVQALLVYPLNALIASQRDRLSDWTAPFAGKVRFSLYNGNTPENLPSAQKALRPWEVLDRSSLRRDPPPLLITNATMLEYMLLRTQDAPILKASQGRLRYVVLDEAHTYIGSQAAEMALLLRRTLHAFGMAPGDVRFVATSATLGSADDPEVEKQLRRFLADMSGSPEDRVQVVLGKRYVPEVAPGSFGGLGSNRSALRLRERLAKSPATLAELDEVAAPVAAIDLLEQGISARSSSGDAFLPLRLHLFHRSQAGLWACVNPGCAGRAADNLDVPEWPFGAILERDSPACAHCRSRTFSVLTCDDCGAPFLDVSIDEGFRRLYRHRDERDQDEFVVEAESDEGEEAEEGQEAGASGIGRQWLLGPAGLRGGLPIAIEPDSGVIRDAVGASTVSLSRVEPHLCVCCGAGSAHRELFRPFRIGGPFFLGVATNVLLDAAPPRPAAAPPLPHQGRQLITFTDSRQGTARFAAVSQQEAERSFARGLIYHAVQSGRPDAAAHAAKLRDEISQLAALGPMAASLLNGKRVELAAIEGGGARPWNDIIEQLETANGSQRELLEMWSGIERRFTNPRELAKLQLLTEFLRRPRRANNLETMGLAMLRFPSIDRLGDASVPSLLRESGATVEDWKDFLYLLVNFVIRGSSAVQVDQGLSHWIGQLARMRSYLPPNYDGPKDRHQLSWPMLKTKGGRLSRPMLLLRDGLRINLDDPAVRSAVNEAMEASYNALLPLRVSAIDDFRLDLSLAEVGPLREAWLCPITRRLIDRCFRGISPYTTIEVDGARKPCERIDLPRLPFPWLKDPEGRDARAAVVAWLRDDPHVDALRKRGLWTDLNDRAALRAPFIRVVEHSAQQPPARLRDYEAKFKAGQINVMNCSTTMEMGVDIGGITTVAMANVPPSPASFRQRVGRAGRRGEALSVSFTYCPDTPLGWHAFDEPGAPLTEPIAAPRVALESRPLVQRHVNALVLGRFLKLKEFEGIKLICGDFFAPALGENAPWKQFMSWLRTEAGNDDVVVSGVARIVARTNLAGRSDLLVRSIDLFTPLVENWLAEHQALEDDLKAADEGPPQKAIELQIKRMEGEFLLGELARGCFLPGHGFPTDVVPFVSMSPAELDRLASGGGVGREREDTTARARQFPTRQLNTAIREYAPGADVVVDGIAYRSAGVTLNWKRPASEEEAAEVQSLRWFWLCGACGTSATSMRRPENCGCCGGTSLRIERVLVPSGFSVDLASEPTNAVETVTFVPPARPVISARSAPWVSLENPELGRVRWASDGTIMARSRGANSFGYVLCLSCGRAEPETSENEGDAGLPERMRRHQPLRGHRRKRPFCDGPERGFSIKRHVALGYEKQTDVFELQLASVADEATAMTMAVALREALCRRLGIARDEIGWQVDRARDADAAAKWSIYLTDNAPGGAGYAITAGADVRDLLERTRTVLDCHNQNCDSACPSCLVVWDTLHVAQSLDRTAAREALDRVIEALELPASSQVFGPGAEQRMATAPLPTEISRAVAARPNASVALVLQGDPSEWDLASWWGSPVMERLGREGAPVSLVINPTTLAALSFENVLALKGLRDRAGNSARLVRWATAPQPAHVLGFVYDDQEWTGWAPATPEEASVRSNPPSALIRGVSRGTPFSMGAEVDFDQTIRRLRPTTVRLTIREQLDGSIASFGARFWSALKELPAFSAWVARQPELVRIRYTDRYMFSPLAVRLLHSVLSTLPVRMPRESRLPLSIATMASRTDQRYNLPDRLHDDWASSVVRDDILKAILGRAGFALSLEIADRRELVHARCLTIETKSHGSVDLLLDQGFGHWVTRNRVAFDFTVAAPKQASALLLLDASVMGDRGKSTEVFVDFM